VQVNNWKFRIPIDGGATIKLLMSEISRRASNKLTTLQQKLSESATSLNMQLEHLLRAVDKADESHADEVAAVTKLFVETIAFRVEEGSAMATTQAKDVEWEMLQACDELEECQKRVVKATIISLRNPGDASYFEQLQDIVHQTMNANSRITITQTVIKVIDLKTLEGADLDPYDTVGAVLDTETTLLASLEKRDEDEQRKLQAEERKKEEESRKQKEMEELMLKKKTRGRRRRKEVEGTLQFHAR